MKKSVFVFILLYALFYASSVLFPIDREWYDALNKPSWTPSGQTIGMIWAAAVIYHKYGFRPKAFWLLFVINYVVNQLFSFFQFQQKRFIGFCDRCQFGCPDNAAADNRCRQAFSKLSAWLLVPYLLWNKKTGWNHLVPACFYVTKITF
ncbi:tryptophan-rich sensory protein [Fictibacillus enclensis]|uniref:tryptophan-rich sensory protein n=1 Tax=Fictibacillus enclensis TaxID=1017270 RepID=UPI0025A110A8|nr:tryptophan-rich sensory protein [Fictibacillus enclensis]MDM5339948.1 tryptophan-rich sensory protein [Fictibacillus enclensis]